MKKTITGIISLFIFVVAFGIFTLTAGAAETLSLTSKMAAVGTVAGFGTKSLAATLGGIIQGFLMLLGVIFMAYTVYAGYNWMTAAGNDEKITKSKAILRGSVIGLIIILGAYAISAFIINQISKSTGYQETTTTTITQ